MDLRPLVAADYAWVERLNAANISATGPMDRDWLERAAREWFLGVAAIASDAFLIAFNEAAAYDSPNFLWFRSRYPRFVYVDRIVIAEHMREAGLGRLIYECLFDATRASGRDLIVCEVNIPNSRSDAFHARMGFVECGQADLQSGKSVRYLAKSLT